MIELTVKTLDSQNHQFSVDDDITVEQFKIKIADTVNIAADTQRIIYCGRVLQDNLKLADYDVNGKVVHLVQRPPPGTTPRSNSRSSSPQPQRRGFRGFRGLEQGNAMYLGSMAFPGNLMESQGIVPPPPTHSLSGSRLNVARRMLRRAEAVIQMLENPTARSQDQPASEENQEDEEVTPVIEARVVVPNNIEPIDEVLNAVQNTLMNASNNPSTLSNSRPSSIPSSSEATPLGATPRSSSTENLTAESRSSANGFPENASRTAEMSELLTMLGQLQIRFAPFLERYQTFMNEDPEVTTDNQRSTQTMLNRVSEVMHFLGHAYHSLSDLIIRVRTPPPRPLLCRPILIQHSAVVQTGIPIQVEVIEAQINLSADRVSQPATSQAGTTAEDSNNTSTSTTTTAPSTNNANVNTTNARQAISIQPGFVGLPFITNAAMRVQPLPLEIRSIRPVNQPRPQTNTTESTTASTTNTTDTTNNSSSNTIPNRENSQPGSFNLNNPNVEFFMEVTPEGITIDSLETTVVGSNQANDFIRGALNGPPPEFLQSLMQMAGQIINRNITNPNASTASTEPTPAQSTQRTTTTTTSSGQTATSTPNQPTQIRVNAQTANTTSTNTRATSRPHVHLAQQAMQGGFDPFLPCNSHHISRRRVQPQATTAPTASATPNSNTSNAPSSNETPAASGDQRNVQQNIMNLLSGMYDSLRSQSDTRRSTESGTRHSSNAPSNSANGDHIMFGSPNIASLNSLLSNLPGGLNLPDLLRQGPTIDQLLHQFQDDQYVPGESIIVDLIMLLIRNLTLLDLFTLYNGNVDPINRNVNEIQTFFRTRICEGDISPTGIDRGIERLIREMQPFLENFGSLQVRNDIDMVRSAEQLFRQRLPNIINIAVHLTTNTTRILIDQCLTTAKQLLALTLLASANAQRGVEQVYEQIMTHFMRDIPQDIQNWTVMTSLVQLRQIVANLSVPEGLLQPYIVHRTSRSVLTTNNEETVVQKEPEVEQMDVDVQEIRTEINRQILTNDPEPLEDVVIGSESWHGQVPEDWVPIITRDAQKQRRQNPQGPFSDAYLSGMPSKRRKIVTNSKPHGSLSQVISESVRHAVTVSGLTPVAPLEVVAEAAGESTELQNAYRNLLRSTVQSNLADNEDFLPDRYPNISKYFNGSQ
ncbi:large proline-rich protein bag6-B isoform X2 [Diorhabda sublineata]|uniref:large proline-rich protein bag6-B isoform X2 n=1 Tax=Diorhabda sublineata TaxID=1163346 RepID=UPI0024E0FFB2|nr:large proline-rich protein bag6-B isoform X2 [Diorhabda sublineata]